MTKPSGGSCGGAPTTAEYLLGASDPALPNGRVAASTSSVAVDLSTPGAVSWSLVSGYGYSSYSFDFSAQADQTIAADGNYVIGGKTFTAANVLASSTFAVQNGQGLRIDALTGSQTWNGTAASITAPALWIDLADLLPDVLRVRSTLDIWFRVTNVTVPVVNNSFACGLWSAEGTGYSGTMVATGYSNGSTNDGPMLQQGSTRSVSVDGSLTDDAVLLSIPFDGVALSYSGTYSAGWPAENTLNPAGRGISGYGTAQSSTLVVRRSGARLCFAATTNTAMAGSTPGATVRSFEIIVGPALR